MNSRFSWPERNCFPLGSTTSMEAPETKTMLEILTIALISSTVVLPLVDALETYRRRQGSTELSLAVAA